MKNVLEESYKFWLGGLNPILNNWNGWLLSFFYEVIKYFLGGSDISHTVFFKINGVVRHLWIRGIKFA